MSNQLSVLVTGASTGIGRTTAEYLAMHGFHIYAGARSRDDLNELQKITNLTPVRLDVTSARDLAAVKKIIEDKKTGLFGLVNNAGITIAGALMDVSVEDMRRQFEVNLFGVHQITQTFFPFILEAQGRIVMMSSDSGFFATPFVGPYCASKFALEGYADSLRREIIPHGVKVVLIEPGRILTPIWRKGEENLTRAKYPNSLFWREASLLGRNAIEKGKTTGLLAVEVAKVIHRALTTKKPKLRYLVARNRFEYRLMKILPAGYVDRLVRRKVRKITRLT